MVETFPLGMAARYACGFRGNLGTRTLSLLPALRLRTICGNSARAWVRRLLKVDMRGLRGSDAKWASDAPYPACRDQHPTSIRSRSLQMKRSIQRPAAGHGFGASD